MLPAGDRRAEVDGRVRDGSLAERQPGGPLSDLAQLVNRIGVKHRLLLTEAASHARVELVLERQAVRDAYQGDKASLAHPLVCPGEIVEYVVAALFHQRVYFVYYQDE